MGTLKLDIKLRKHIQDYLVSRDGSLCYICERLIVFQFHVFNSPYYSTWRYRYGKIHFNRLGFAFTERGVRLPFRMATIDHYIPVSRGGTDTIDNLRIACLLCNQNKADLVPLPEWLQ